MIWRQPCCVVTQRHDPRLRLGRARGAASTGKTKEATGQSSGPAGDYKIENNVLSRFLNRVLMVLRGDSMKWGGNLMGLIEGFGAGIQHKLEG